VTVGLAIGAQEDASSSPVAGDHEQLTPPEPDRATDPPGSIVPPPEATATGAGSTVIVTCGALVETQPPASVTVRV
jgi:hypothetical protein